jgi:Na+/phosphate symporter
MTLGRLALAWIVVAAWFEIAAYATHYIVTKLVIPPGATVYAGIPTHLIKRRAAEAALVSLIASLWFDSIGSGESWLLFLLIGALVTSPAWFVRALDPIPKRAIVADTVCNLLRYVVAGALLAWRLS